MASPRLRLLTRNTMGAVKYMLDTASRHKFVTGGMAVGAAFTVAHHNNPDNRPEEDAPDPSVYQSGKSRMNNAAYALFGSATMPPPNTAGLDTAQPANIQLDGAGYENPAVQQQPTVDMVDPNMGSGDMTAQIPMSSGRMGSMSDTRYQPSNSIITNNNAINNF